PLFDEPLDDARDVELVAPPLEAEGEVLEVDEDRQRPFPVCHSAPHSHPQPLSPEAGERGARAPPTPLPRRGGEGGRGSPGRRVVRTMRSKSLSSPPLPS